MNETPRAAAKGAACLVGALAVAALLGAACGSGSASDGFGGPSSPYPGSSSGGSSGSSSGGGSGGGFTGGDAGLPPETKTEGTYQSPVSTGQIVWIANPTSGRVAYIDARSFGVQTVEAGDGPTYLAAVPDPSDDVAIVLNVLSRDATLLRDHQGMLSTKTFPSTADANSWAVSSSGRWAIAWTNATLIANADPTQGFQDMAVLDLSGARPPTVLSVGYRPSQVAFSGDASRAFAVTQDGISVVDLLGGAQPTVTSNFALAAPPPPPSADAATMDAPAADTGASDASPDGPVGEASTAEASTPSAPTPAPNPTPDVSFTPGGAYALVRLDGSRAISIVALKDGTLTTVALPSPATDLTVSPAGDFAVAVMRDISTVAVLPLPGVVTSPSSFTTTVITGETVGRAIVTAGGKSVLLFTTAAAIDRLTVLTLQPSPAYRTVALHAPILAVFPTPDAQNAVVLHQVTSDPTSGVAGAFSLVPIGADLPAKIVGVPAPPTAVALAPTSDRAVVSVRDDASKTYGLYLGMMPSLQVLAYPLSSPPIAVGIAQQAHRGYAAQDYSEGRITFVDLAADGCDASSSCTSVRTITGFELGARVVNGSNP
jgi:hypothetical protein